ncbi:MAG: 2-succinyl-6-hydroxy-2,4-cyclohexadiene-1-carboxylate synthase [Fodinibius sp.]|nr:2-succinyl-6-hydroxy-2,4-cyclohexadiene-1-carboxylate synthase [Fodinibius sp.]
MGLFGMKQLNINGQTYACNIHQRDEQLPYLLMLHGFMGDRRVFSHLINELISFCNPITVDLLGFGRSSKPTKSERYQVQNQIQDLSLLIEQLDLNSVILFGYSMGGRLALNIALRQQAIFDGLVLESANCGITDPQERAQRQQLDARWAQQIGNDFDAFLSDWKKLELFQSPLPTNKALVQRYYQIQLEQQPEALAASLRGFGTGSMPPICDQLRSIKLPTLLLAGTADEKYQRINHNLVDQLSNATFSSIKAGHRTHLDNPSALVAELRTYFNEHI